MLRINQLIGFDARRATGAASGPITSLAYVASTTSTAASITAPASISVGDLLVLVQYSRNASSPAPTVVTPTGFTNIVSHFSANQSSGEISYRIADGTESSASYTGMDGDTQDDKIMWQHRANAAIASLTAVAATVAFSSGDPAPQTISASAGTGIVLGITTFGCNSSLGSVNPRTTSITPNHELNSSTAFYSHDYIQASSPADYTWDMDDEGNNNRLMGCYFHNMST